MHRRQFLAAVSAAFVSARSVLGLNPKQYLGLMTPTDAQALRERGKFYRVILNGEDVTHGCVDAHDHEGWADVHVKGSDGGLMLQAPEYDSIATLRHFGSLEFRSVSAEDWRQLVGVDKRQHGPHRLSGDNPMFREFKKAANDSAKYAESLKTASLKTGVSTEKLAELKLRSV